MSQFRSDLRFAWRTLKAKPVFTVIAVLSLVVGIGIRLALGATGGDVLWGVLRQCLTIAAAGLAAGIFEAIWCTTFLKSMLYGVATDDFTAYAAAVSLILVIAVCAALAPAVRAARVDPVTALRYE